MPQHLFSCRFFTKLLELGGGICHAWSLLFEQVHVDSGLGRARGRGQENGGSGVSFIAPRARGAGTGAARAPRAPPAVYGASAPPLLDALLASLGETHT